MALKCRALRANLLPALLPSRIPRPSLHVCSQTEYSKLTEDRGSQEAARIRISLTLNPSQSIPREGFAPLGGSSTYCRTNPRRVPRYSQTLRGRLLRRTGYYDVVATPSFGVSDLTVTRQVETAVPIHNLKL